MKKKNLSHLAGYLAHRDLGDVENLYYFHFVHMIKRAGSLTENSPLKGEISVSGMNRNPYKPFSPIQTIMASVTRYH